MNLDETGIAAPICYLSMSGRAAQRYKRDRVRMTRVQLQPPPQSQSRYGAHFSSSRRKPFTSGPSFEGQLESSWSRAVMATPDGRRRPHHRSQLVSTSVEILFEASNTYGPGRSPREIFYRARRSILVAPERLLFATPPPRLRVFLGLCPSVRRYLLDFLPLPRFRKPHSSWATWELCLAGFCQQ